MKNKMNKNIFDEALHNLRINNSMRVAGHHVLTREQYSSVLTALTQAQKRDTPMKPLIDKLDLWDEHRCPICKSVVWEVHVHRDENFCSNCGQRLDWEEA